MRAHRREREQIVEPEHAVGGGPLEQRVQHLTGRGRVGVRAVDRLGRGPEMTRQRRQPEVRDLVADQPARERDGVDPPVREPRVAVLDERGVEEADVEAHVVADDHGAVRELEERGQHLGDLRRGHEHGVGDAGEHGDHRRDGYARVHQRLERAEQLAAAQSQRTDLGDRVGARRRAGRLEVDDDERDLRQRRAEVVERLLTRRARRCRGRRLEARERPARTGK